MKPTKGRIVMFNQGLYPAIIMDVHSDECVSLNVFTHGGVLVKTSVMLGDNENQWNWPVREEAKS